MAFNFGNLSGGSNYCFGTTGTVSLPNFGVAITGPPLTIACFARPKENNGRMGAGSKSSVEQCPDCYPNNPRGKNYTIFGIGNTSSSPLGQKFALEFDAHAFLADYSLGQIENSSDTYNCCCDFVDPNNPFQIDETDCIASYAYAYPAYDTPKFIPGVTTDCSTICSDPSIKLLRNRFVARYYTRGTLPKAYQAYSVGSPIAATPDNPQPVDPTRMIGIGSFYTPSFADPPYSYLANACTNGDMCDEISLGGYHRCSRSGFYVGCTGHNGAGQCNVPAGNLNVAQVEISEWRPNNAALRTTSGRILFWGGYTSAYYSPDYSINGLGSEWIFSSGDTAHDMAMGNYNICAIYGNAKGITCRGYMTLFPQVVSTIPTDTGYVSIKSGKTSRGLNTFQPEFEEFFIALKNDGTVTAWGKTAPGGPIFNCPNYGDPLYYFVRGNQFGQLDVPAKIQGQVKQIAAGTNTAYALLDDGTLECWGMNNWGQCDRANEYNAAGITFTKIAAYETGWLALTAGKTLYWGGEFSWSNWIPSGFTADDLISSCNGISDRAQFCPPRVGIELSSDSLIVGVIKNGGVTLFGIVNCPVGRCSSSAGCTYTNTGTNTISAKIGKHAAFSIQQDGKLVPWAPVPFGCYTTIPGQTEFKKLMKFGVSHSLALYKTSNGQTGLTGWGSNTSGQLNFPDGITAIMAQGGLNHTVILRQNGGITAFGDNSLQQCNVNATLRAANAAKYVAAGYDFNVAILANNGLTAWGDNTYNQCNIPAGITSTKVVCGAYHALALSAGGTVFGWGRGNDPNGSCIACDCKQAVIPNEVATASGDDTIVDIEASSCQSFAVTRTGKVISWGDGNCGVDNLLPGSLNSIISGPCGVDQQGDLLMSPQNGLTLPIFFSSSYFGAVGKFTGSPEIQINEWYHLAGILKNDANNTRVLYVNDNKTTDSLAMGGCTFSPNSKIIIGGVIGNDYDWFKSNTTFDGDVSEAAIWNVELTEDELAMLRKGIKPIYVRPQNLIFYAPLTTDNVINYAAGNLLTLKINSNAVTSSTINKNSDILGNIVDHTIRYG